MKIKKYILYVLYAAAVFLVFLYMLFPGRQMAGRLSAALSEKFPEARIDVDRLTLAFPPGLKAEFVQVSLKNGRDFQVDSVVIYPEFTTLIKEKKTAELNINAFDGEIKGRVTTDFPGDFALSDLDLNFSRLKIQQLELQSGLSSAIVDFNAQGACQYPVLSADRIKGTGRIHLSGVKFRISSPFLDQLGIHQFDFNAVDIHYEQNNNTLTVLECIGTGSEFKKISLKGTVDLHPKFKKSRVSFKGELIPDPSCVSNLAGVSSMAALFSDAFKGIPFTVTGTFEKLNLSL
ncbi:MAG: type II secretion system protein GspN [Thermodesulfobacteriota bacterium]|nr:type II secretion system protein GspN [Thermodesulfobacteriota bacterium]